MADPKNDEPVDAEVIPPGAPPPKKSAEPPAGTRTFFHPLSGLVILGVDWLAFGLDLPTEFLFTPVVAVGAFAITFWAVSKIQERHGDEPRTAMLKAFLGATAAGIPFPITGTIVGSIILMLSGLPKLRLKRLP